MRKLRALSLDEPAPLPKEAMPLLVTFDDILSLIHISEPTRPY